MQEEVLVLSSRGTVAPQEMSFGVKIVCFMRNDVECCAAKNVGVGDCSHLLFKQA